MQSYRQTFINGEGSSAMVLDADNEYFNQFNGN
jgi:membrane protease subunit HflC